MRWRENAQTATFSSMLLLGLRWLARRRAPMAAAALTVISDEQPRVDTGAEGQSGDRRPD